MKSAMSVAMKTKQFKSIAQVANHLLATGKISRGTAANWSMAIQGGMAACVAGLCRDNFGLVTIKGVNTGGEETGCYTLPA